MNVIEQGALPVPPTAEPMDYYGMNDATNFVTDGPLAQAYGQALDQLYRKEVDPATGIVLESQQQQVSERQRWLEAAVGSVIPPDKKAMLGMLYGVKAVNLAHEDLMRVTDAVGRMNPQQKLASAVVIDASDSGVSASSAPLAAALESYCTQHGVAVYRSLDVFLKHHGS